MTERKLYLLTDAQAQLALSFLPDRRVHPGIQETQAALSSPITADEAIDRVKRALAKSMYGGQTFEELEPAMHEGEFGPHEFTEAARAAVAALQTDEKEDQS